MLLNAVVGLFIVLAAWLIVDFVMKSLYNPDAWQEGSLGPWNSILVGGDTCVQPKTPSAIGGLPGVISNAITGTGIGTSDGVCCCRRGGERCLFAIL